MDSASHPAAVGPPFLIGAEVLAAVALGVAAGTAATGAGATAAAFAASIAAQRSFVPAIIAGLPAALIFRFAGAVGPTAVGGYESCSTDGSTAFRPGSVALPFAQDPEGPRSPLLFCFSRAAGGRVFDHLP
jgi:hypothetical protein